MKTSVARSILEKPAKAGVLLYEQDQDGNRRFLVPYNEGRFAKNGRYLVLPKGSVDAGESAIVGGIRETSEETGFPLADFLGEANITQLQAGKTLRHVKHQAFPGFEIIEASPKAYPHLYHARGGRQQAMVLYAFKVKGLDTLAPCLKNSEGKTTKRYLDEHREMPRFPTFLEWMKQGYIPATGELPKVPLFRPIWFKRAIDKWSPEGIEVPGNWQRTRENWQRFCASLEGMEYSPERDQFHQAFSLIKQRLKDEGLIGGDLSQLKFDDKDCPLFYYTEGAVIEDADKIIRQTFRDMKANADYARAFGGMGTKVRGLNPVDSMLLGQVAAYSPHVRASLWRQALREEMDATGRPADDQIEHAKRVRRHAVAMQAPSPASGRSAG